MNIFRILNILINVSLLLAGAMINLWFIVCWLFYFVGVVIAFAYLKTQEMEK